MPNVTDIVSTVAAPVLDSAAVLIGHLIANATPAERAVSCVAEIMALLGAETKIAVEIRLQEQDVRKIAAELARG